MKKTKSRKKPSIPQGRTLKTKDKYLSHDKNRATELKNKRWVSVIEINKKNELAVVRLTSANTRNTTELLKYRKGNKIKTYFKHFIEVSDNEGKPIKIDNRKFIDSKQAKANRSKIKEFEKR